MTTGSNTKHTPAPSARAYDFFRCHELQRQGLDGGEVCGDGEGIGSRVSGQPGPGRRAFLRLLTFPHSGAPRPPFSP